MSTKRISNASSLPPKKPEVSPIVTPRTSAMPTDISPTCSETWEPCRIRASVSRPSSSVPIGCAQLGSSRRMPTRSFGSIDQTNLPKSAIRTLKKTITAPAIPIGFFHFARRPDRRVET
jgi:hypothetical protein